MVSTAEDEVGKAAGVDFFALGDDGYGGNNSNSDVSDSDSSKPDCYKPQFDFSYHGKAIEEFVESDALNKAVLYLI